MKLKNKAFAKRSPKGDWRALPCRVEKVIGLQTASNGDLRHGLPGSGVFIGFHRFLPGECLFMQLPAMPATDVGTLGEVLRTEMPIPRAISIDPEG